MDDLPVFVVELANTLPALRLGFGLPLATTSPTEEYRMTLFISCLLIYQFDMNPWLYAAAAVLWIAHTCTFWWAHVLTADVARNRR